MSTDVSLKQLLADNRLTIGVVKGRQYGSEIDRLIESQAAGLYVGAGANKAERLHRMFTQGKLDAIIEYSAVVTSRKIASGDISEYFVYPLKEAQQTASGYIDCSKSALGKRVKSDFEDIMNSAAYQSYGIKEILTEQAIVEPGYMIEKIGYK